MNSELESLKRALEASPENVELACLVAGKALEVGEDQMAENLLLDLTRRFPDDKRVLLLLMKLYYSQAKFSDAAIHAERARAVDDSVETIHLSTKIELECGNLEMARELFRKLLSRQEFSGDETLETRLGILTKDGPIESLDDDFDEVRLKNDMTIRINSADSSIDFSQVGGMETLKKRIQMKIVEPFRNPALFEKYGKKAGGGILLYGPPGCGKTHIARATAGECDATFVHVGIHDILDMYIGQSEQRLHEIFEYARSRSPAILFFDEVDALGSKRSDMRSSNTKMMVNQFLSEMDGVADNEGVLIIGATNAPWDVDSAFRRTGRFDETLFVAPPDKSARAEILKIHLRGRPIDDLDPIVLADLSEGLSGADLKGWIFRATESALEEALESGEVIPINLQRMKMSLDGLMPSAAEWLESARNYAVYANQSGIWDELRDYLETGGSTSWIRRIWRRKKS